MQVGPYYVTRVDKLLYGDKDTKDMQTKQKPLSRMVPFFGFLSLWVCFPSLHHWPHWIENEQQIQIPQSLKWPPFMPVQICCCCSLFVGRVSTGESFLCSATSQHRSRRILREHVLIRSFHVLTLSSNLTLGGTARVYPSVLYGYKTGSRWKHYLTSRQRGLAIWRAKVA